MDYLTNEEFQELPRKKLRRPPQIRQEIKMVVTGSQAPQKRANITKTGRGNCPDCTKNDIVDGQGGGTLNPPPPTEECSNLLITEL